ncbi:class I SAM-dependent DNA methyltransferase, partial [Methylomonas rivi]|nr:hypothetical protein [Methylomonas sp. WSC-6]
ANILKVICPLFLDDLKAELKKIGKNDKKLFAFQQKLASLQFFDPACGCGNFLVIAYRELRLLEMEVIEAIYGKSLSGQLNVDTLILCNVHQFHGIEIDPSAAQIATVALWLTDHQMNLRVQRFGNYYSRIPLVKKANIICGNALQIDWNDVLPAKQCGFVMGNPPFIGAKYMTAEQRADIEPIFKPLKNGGLLDYVAAWYVKAASFIQNNPKAPVAFVSTNSITQGEQVGVLWPYLFAHGIKIHFAHRTFRWSNEGRGVAAVHCVIVGFGLGDTAAKTLYEYEDINGGPTVLSAKHINPYLVDAPDVTLTNRKTPLCDVPEIGIGNKPIDGGHYLFTPEEKDAFLTHEPQAAKWFRRWIGADEFINGYERWCLWLGDCPPNELRQMPEAMKRVESVRKTRLASKSAPTQKLAATPTRFHVENIPDAPYLVIPEVSSERRQFIPVGFMQPDTLSSNLVRILPHATLYHFGILTSTMHNAWMRTVCGRLKSDYRYSVGIVYNNFPWPTLTDKQGAAIEAAGQAVLDARAQFPGSTLADLYDPLAMPPELVKAHAELDKAVDAAYGYKGKKDDAARVAFLFGLYQNIVNED